MTLNDFRTQEIKWDKANQQMVTVFQASSGDSNGRKLSVQVLDEGKIVDLTGIVLSLAWQTKNEKNYGLDAFQPVDATKGIFEIFYTTEMLSNIGTLRASLVLVDGTGRVESDSFSIMVKDSVVNDSSVQSDNSFTALTEALVQINQYQTEIDGIKQNLINDSEALLSLKETEFNELYTSEKTELDNLELDYATRAENLEAEYAPRLNDVTAQLAKKANKDELPSSAFNFKGTVSVFEDLPTENNEIGDQYRVDTDDTNYAWNGTSWGNIGSFEINENSVKEKHLQNDSISLKKTNFYKESKNELNKSTLVANGQTIDISNGGFYTSDSPYWMSDFIEVNESENYVFMRKYKTDDTFSYAVVKYCFYDENKAFIEGGTTSSSDSVLIPPLAAKYVILSYTYTLEDTDMIFGLSSYWSSFSFAKQNFEEYWIKINDSVLPETSSGGDTTNVSIGTSIYPFAQDSTINNDETLKAKILDAIKEIKLYGADKKKSYRISQLRRKRPISTTGVDRWTVIITDSDNNDVSLFQFEPYDEPVGLTEIFLKSMSYSGVTARIWIDWTKLPEMVDLPGMSEGVMTLDKKTFINSFESQGYNRNFRDIPEFHYENVEDSTTRIYEKQEYKNLTFPILTDIHTITDNSSINSSVEAMSYLTERIDADFIALLGDYIVGDVGKAESLKLVNDVMTLTKKHAKCPVFPVKGNHDSNDFMPGFSSKTDEEKRELLITNKEFYIATNKKAEKYGIVVDENNPYGGWYYVDFPRQKIRGVFLNTTEMDETDGVVNVPRHVYGGVQSQAQLDWLSNTALKFDGKENSEEWAVMMFSHVPPFAVEEIHNRSVDRPGFRAVCEAFKNGTSGTYEETYATSTFDFTEQGGREFIGHFLGHVHEDSHTVINGINYFISNSVTPYKRWSTSLERDAYGERTLSSNTVIVNREERKVSIIKTGTGQDWEFTW